MTARYVLWGFLALPAIVMMQRYAVDTLSYGEVIHESGIWSVRLLILTMAVTPLRVAFGNVRWTGWLLRQRRAFGVATFAYALLHTVVYVARKVDIGLMIEEAMEPDLAIGWMGFAVFAVLALTSNDASVRLLRRKWKPVHRLVYVGALLMLAHWYLAAFDPALAYVYFAILAALEAARMILPLVRQR